MKNEKKTITQSRNMISEVKQPLENKIKHNQLGGTKFCNCKPKAIIAGLVGLQATMKSPMSKARLRSF